MSFKHIITAAVLLSAVTLPALAEDFASDPARAYPLVQQHSVFGGVVASETALRQEAKTPAAVQTDAGSGSSLAPPAISPHAYDYLKGPSIPAGG
jgi:hypothetical protein